MNACVARIIEDWCRHPLAGLTCTQASEVASRLGGLAVWWLRREVLNLAAEDESFSTAQRDLWRDPYEVFQTADLARPLLVSQNDEQQYPLLRPAMALPLVWRRGRDHDERLPRSFLAVAEQVIESLSLIDEVRNSRWGIGLPDDGSFDGLDLSALKLDTESAWLPLAGDLWVRSRGRGVDPTLWATGAWSSDRGLGPVGGGEAKMRAARDYGGKTFCLPATMMEHLEPVARALGLTCRAIDVGPCSPEKVLQPYAECALIRPGPAASFEQCVAHYVLLLDLADRDTAFEYYDAVLLDQLAARHNKELQGLMQARKGHEDVRLPSHLVTVFGQREDPSVLAIKALQPKRCLVFHTPDRSKGVQEMLTRAATPGDITPEAFDENMDDLAGHFLERIRAWLGQTPVTELAIDLTPGSKRHSLSLYQAAPAGTTLLYLKHEWDPKRRIARVNTAKYLLLQSPAFA